MYIYYLYAYVFFTAAKLLIFPVFLLFYRKKIQKIN